MAKDLNREVIAYQEVAVIRAAAKVYAAAPDDLARRAITQRLIAHLRRSPLLDEGR